MTLNTQRPRTGEHPGKKLRKALGLSQAKFAETLGLHQPNVSAVEAGVRGRSYSRRTVLAIMDRYRRQCRKLGVTAEDLVRGDARHQRRSGGSR